MTTEAAYLERIPDPARPVKPEPPPLFSTAERIALWAHQYGLPATDREWNDALTGGLIHPPQILAAT
jgi:hypothetical protein